MSNERGYNRALVDSRQRMQRELRLGEWLKNNQRVINAKWKLIQDFIDRHPETDFYSSIISTAAHNECGAHVVYMSLTLRQLNGLKDPILEEALTPFVEADESRCSDYPNILNRDYSFDYNFEGGKINVLISAYVKEDNPTCRKILVERRSETKLVAWSNRTSSFMSFHAAMPPA